jgi:hypothetical protein
MRTSEAAHRLVLVSGFAWPAASWAEPGYVDRLIGANVDAVAPLVLDFLGTAYPVSERSQP